MAYRTVYLLMQSDSVEGMHSITRLQAYVPKLTVANSPWFP